MNLPGRIHVMDLKEDSRLEMVETWATRKDSYWAKGEDIESKDRRGKPRAGGRWPTRRRMRG